MRRGRILFRGPGVLACVLLLAIAGTAFARHNVHTTQALPTYSLTVSQGHLATDPVTGLQARMQRVDANAFASGTTIRITVLIGLRNLGRHRRTFHSGDIFAVDQNGQSFVPASTKAGAMRIAPNGGAILPISFVVPRPTQWIEIEWNDGGLLLPPKTLAVLAESRHTSAHR